MATRPTMADLIARTRGMIGDPAGANPQFTDDQVQDALDAHRTDARQASLRLAPTMTGAGAVYREWRAPIGGWEENPVLEDSEFVSLTPDESDLARGIWTFNAGVPGPVYVTGQAYDLFGAAVELLEAWAGAVATEFDFETDQQSFSRSQKQRALLRLAGEYRRKARPRVARFVQGDAWLPVAGFVATGAW